MSWEGVVSGKFCRRMLRSFSRDDDITSECSYREGIYVFMHGVHSSMVFFGVNWTMKVTCNTWVSKGGDSRYN